MAEPVIKIKRSSVPGKIPTTISLPVGEFGINTNDGKVYIQKDSVGIGSTVIVVNPWSVGLGSTAYNTFFTVGSVGIGTTAPTSSLHVVGNTLVTGIVTATAFYGNGSNLTSLSGMGTAVSSSGFGVDVFFTNLIGYVDVTTTLSSPNPSSAPTLYTRYEDIVVSDGVDLIIGNGNELLTDVLKLSQLNFT